MNIQKQQLIKIVSVICGLLFIIGLLLFSTELFLSAGRLFRFLFGNIIVLVIIILFICVASILAKE